MYIDAHAHLDKYASEMPLIIHAIESSAICTVSVSTTPQSYAAAKAAAAQSRWITGTFGIHPWDAPAFHKQMESLQPLIDDSPMIGEIGLDYHFVSDPESHSLQREVFRYMVKQGVAQGKILNIHSKGAEADVNRILGELGAFRAILHWYSGPIEVLQALVEKKFYFSVGVDILFCEQSQKIARMIPSTLLLTETDNPGGYQWLTGSAGMPSIIRSVVQKLSELRNWSIEETQKRIEQNFLRLVEGDNWTRNSIF